MLTLARYGTKDLPRALAFYDGITALIGARRVHDLPNAVCYQGAGGMMFIIGTPFAGDAVPGNGTQLSFMATTRDVVKAVHAKALASGGSDEGAPGVRGPDPNGFFAGYFRDPDGNKWMVYNAGPAA